MVSFWELQRSCLMWVVIRWGESFQSEDSWGFPSSFPLNLFCPGKKLSPPLTNIFPSRLLLEGAVRPGYCTPSSATRTVEYYRISPVFVESEGPYMCVRINALKLVIKDETVIITHISVGAGGSCNLCYALHGSLGHKNLGPISCFVTMNRLYRSAFWRKT